MTRGKKQGKQGKGKGAGRFRQAVAASTVYRPKTRGGEERKDAIERGRRKEKCPVHIGAQDVEKKADALARVIQDRKVVLEERREALSKFRDRLKYFDERLDELSESVSSHTEVRDVEVVEFLLERTGEVVLIRQDTGEQVGEARAATSDDRQDKLPLEGKKADDGNGADDDEEADDDDVKTFDDLMNDDDEKGDARAGDGG